jgi:hypothetical protein
VLYYTLVSLKNNFSLELNIGKKSLFTTLERIKILSVNKIKALNLMRRIQKYGRNFQLHF